MRLSRELERTLRRYVLGELSEEARLPLEERLVTDSEVFEALGVMEDQLADEYLEDAMSTVDKGAFERNFLTTSSRQQQLRFIQRLRNHASTTATSRPRESEPGYWSRIHDVVWPNPVWTGAFAALFAVLVVGMVWSAGTTFRLRSQLLQIRAQQAVAEEQQRQLQERLVTLTERTLNLQGQLKSARQQDPLGGATAAIFAEPKAQGQELQRLQVEALRQGNATPTFVLATGLLRSGGSLTRIIIPAGAQLIRLRLALPGHDYSLYRAVLYDAQSDEIWTQSKLPVDETASGQAAVTLFLPSRLLAAGDYQVRLSGMDGRGEPEPVGTYSFRAPAR